MAVLAQRVGYDLIVIGNNKLKSLEGLGALKEVGGELWVANNRNLTSTKALEALEKVGGWRAAGTPRYCTR